MLMETLDFDAIWGAHALPNSLRSRAIRACVRFIESQTGARFSYDAAKVAFGRPELLDLFLLANKLKEQKVIRGYRPIDGYADEPPLCAWRADIVSSQRHESTSSGAHHTDHRAALTATLAEATERHVWFERVDYFDSPRMATVSEILKQGGALVPEQFAGFSAAQRAGTARLRLEAGSRYLWVRGHSWVSNSAVWIPAQTISGSRELAAERKQVGEPQIVSNTTNGLATGPTRERAVLAGILEIIERDAYMITWLNQLSPPQFSVADLCAKSESLARLVAHCRRYNLEPRAVRMLTDAPAYAVCAALEDTTGHTPAITLGLRAGADPAYAFEKALMEALRIRHLGRGMLEKPPSSWRNDAKAGDIGHLDRSLYWAVEGRAAKLAFLTQGSVQRFDEPWERDSEAEHLARILEWCKKKNYECASVSLTGSAGNPSPWHIEMAVMPEMQPIYLTEQLRHIGGARLAEVPRLLGYAPREEPYIADPHPFV